MGKDKTVFPTTDAYLTVAKRFHSVSHPHPTRTQRGNMRRSRPVLIHFGPETLLQCFAYFHCHNITLSFETCQEEKAKPAGRVYEALR